MLPFQLAIFHDRNDFIIVLRFCCQSEASVLPPRTVPTDSGNCPCTSVF